MTSMFLEGTAAVVIIKYPAVSKHIHMKLSTLSEPTQLLGSHSDGSWRCGGDQLVLEALVLAYEPLLCLAMS